MESDKVITGNNIIYKPLFKEMESRHSQYNIHTSHEPESINPDDHTMQKTSFLKYIGRFEEDNYIISCKKFSKQQKEYLIEAYKNNIPVKIIGAYRNDKNFIISKLNLLLEEGKNISEHVRDKEFNKFRQEMLFVKLKELPNSRELFVFVFPSKQYVGQVASLILAIFEDFNRINSPVEYQGLIEEIHFPQVEKNIAKNTKFSESIREFIRYGDVVIFGNINFFSPTMEKIGFKATTKKWTLFGLNEMFGVKVLINDGNNARAVLIGVTESFWGDASAQYVDAVIRAGARHILYGSKAASMVKKDKIHKVYAPSSFFTIDEKFQISKEIHFSKRRNSIEKLLKAFNIEKSGIAITVPTVIGESQKQRNIYEDINPAIMDCENGHIAEVINSFNNSISGDLIGSGGQDDVTFVPVHFITDYIHRDNEISTLKSDSSHDLSSHEDNPDYVKNRNKTFHTIGAFFATYCLKHGLTEISEEELEICSFEAEGTLKDNMEAVYPMMSNGRGRDAILLLRSTFHPSYEVPAETALAIARISQIFGFIEVFRLTVLKLKKKNIFKSLSEDDKVQLRMLRLKFSAQIGNYSKALKQIENLTSEKSIEILKDNRQIGALCRRKSLVYAHLGYTEEAKNAIKHVQCDDENLSDNHYKQTNKIYEAILGLYLNVYNTPRKINEISINLSEIRNSYFSMKQSKIEWWRTNSNKCAVATLFLDAAIHLESTRAREIKLGLKRLYIAHLLNTQFGGNDKSETFGEIIQAINTPKNVALIALAMSGKQQDHQKINAIFNRQDWIAGLSEKSLTLLSSDKEKRESIVREMIGMIN